MRILGMIFTLWTILGSSQAQAAKFANQFIEFEAPPQWQCVLEGAEWVCQSVVESKKKEAIIVMAAKIRGDQDSFDQYLAHLKLPKSLTSLQGKPMTSEVKYAKSIELNSHAWIDSLHLDSELGGFYTRYLATIKEDIGVLITYSIQKDKYQDYLNEFEVMIKTLRVFRKPGGLNSGDDTKGIFERVKIPDGVQMETVFPPLDDATARKPVKPKATGDEDSLLFLIGAVAIVGFLIYRRRANRD